MADQFFPLPPRQPVLGPLGPAGVSAPSPVAPGADLPLPPSPAGMPPPASVTAGQDGAGAFDWKQLLALIGPMLMAGDTPARAAFLEGWQRAQAMDQQRQMEEREFGQRQQQIDLAASGQREVR